MCTAVAWLCMSAQMLPCSQTGQGHERDLTQYRDYFKRACKQSQIYFRAPHIDNQLGIKTPLRLTLINTDVSDGEPATAMFSYQNEIFMYEK